MEIDVIAGAATGALKGVEFAGNSFRNLNAVNGLRPESDGVECMCWNAGTSGDETEVLCAQMDRQLKVLDTTTGLITPKFRCPGGKGGVRGLQVLEPNSTVATAVESGLVRVWGADGQPKTDIEAGPDLRRMRCSPIKTQCVATGGMENPLKVWDLNSPEKPTFVAKNVRPDWLQLRVPICVQDLHFMADSEQVVTCTGHHQIRVYDPRGSQRRPVTEVEWSEWPLTRVAPTPDARRVLAANTTGALALFDLRAKGRMVQTYKGAAGSIKDVVCHPDHPYVVSCGVDRFIRLHDLNNKQMLHKIYCKVPLNCLVLKKNLSIVNGTLKNLKVKKEEGTSDLSDHSDTSDDEIWGSFGKVHENAKKTSKAKRKIKDLPPEVVKQKRPKKSIRRNGKLVEETKDDVVLVPHESLGDEDVVASKRIKREEERNADNFDERKSQISTKASKKRKKAGGDSSKEKKLKIENIE